MVTKDHVINAQTEWGNGVVKIGSLRENRTDCENFTSDFLDKLYSFENGAVLFKPTKCAVEQFRPTKAEAKSYFIAGDEKKCKEDTGFALSKWSEVIFDNSNIIITQDIAIAMGNYTFCNDESSIKVEYSFVYKTYGDKIKIILHHSSIPFQT